jgi:hypothetical protein
MKYWKWCFLCYPCRGTRNLESLCWGRPAAIYKSISQLRVAIEGWLRQSPAGTDMGTEAEDSIVRSCYQATTGEDIEDFMSAALQWFVGYVYP